MLGNGACAVGDGLMSYFEPLRYYDMTFTMGWSESAQISAGAEAAAGGRRLGGGSGWGAAAAAAAAAAEWVPQTDAFAVRSRASSTSIRMLLRFVL